MPLLDLAAIVFLVVLSSSFFTDVLFSGSQLSSMDLAVFHYPTKQLVRRIVESGAFPYWNPYYSAGQPLAANPNYEIFYPLQWLIFLRDFNFGYHLQIVSHLWLALAGMYLLLRSMSLRIASSMYGAIAFGLGGALLSSIGLLPQLYAVAWFPIVLLFARRHLRNGSASDFCVTALLLGIQMFVGEPVALMETWLLVAAWGVYSGIQETGPTRAVLRNLARVAGMIVAASFVGCVQVLPAIDLARDSVRSIGFSYDVMTTWSMPPVRVVELLFPNWLNHRGPHWMAELYPRHRIPFVLSIYSGLLLPCLAFAAALRKANRRLWIALFAGSSFVLAFGGHTPIFRIVHAVGVRSLRYPEKLVMYGIFVLVIVAAASLDRILEGDRVVLRNAGFAALVVTAIAIAAAPFALDEVRDDWRTAALRGFGLLLLFTWAWIRKPGAAWQVVAIVFTVADLAPIIRDVTPRLPTEFVSPPPVVETLAPDRSTYRIFHEAHWYGITDNAHKFYSLGTGVPWVLRNGLFPDIPAMWGYAIVLNMDYDETNLLSTARFVDSMWRVDFSGQKDWAPIFMAMSNARYRAEYREFGSEMRRIRGDVKHIQPVDFTDHGPTPRYYFADQIAVASSPDEFVRKIVHGRWSRRVAFVDRGPFTPARGAVLRVAETPNTIDLDVDCSGDSFLVLSVTRHKYWRATIDSRAVTPETVNLTYQGLRVPRGRHAVHFVYRNPITNACLPISALATLALAIGSVWRRRVARRDL